MYMLHHESHVPAHVALRITLVANPQRKSSSFLVTILKKSAKSPPPLQQYQWLRPTKWPRRAKITEKKLEVGLMSAMPPKSNRCWGWATSVVFGRTQLQSKGPWLISLIDRP